MFPHPAAHFLAASPMSRSIASIVSVSEARYCLVPAIDLALRVIAGPTEVAEADRPRSRRDEARAIIRRFIGVARSGAAHAGRDRERSGPRTRDPRHILHI